MGRTAAGVKGMKIPNGEIIGVSTFNQGKFILSIGKKGIGKLTPIEEYRKTNRNAKGVKALKVTVKTGQLVSIKSVNIDDEILIITIKNKIIRIPVSQIRETGRNTSGVKLVNIENEDDRVKDIAVLKKELLDTEKITNTPN
jgi:DNA gyrase subunit A